MRNQGKIVPQPLCKVFSTMPSLSLNISNFPLSRDLTKISTTYESKGIYSSTITPLWTLYPMKMYQILMCLERSWNNGFSNSLIQFLLSLYNIIRFQISSINSTNNLRTHIDSQPLELVALYFSYVEWITTASYLLLNQGNICKPKLR